LAKKKRTGRDAYIDDVIEAVKRLNDALFTVYRHDGDGETLDQLEVELSERHHQAQHAGESIAGWKGNQIVQADVLDAVLGVIQGWR